MCSRVRLTVTLLFTIDSFFFSLNRVTPTTYTSCKQRDFLFVSAVRFNLLKHSTLIGGCGCVLFNISTSIPFNPNVLVFLQFLSHSNVFLVCVFFFYYSFIDNGGVYFVRILFVRDDFFYITLNGISKHFIRLYHTATTFKITYDNIVGLDVGWRFVFVRSFYKWKNSYIWIILLLLFGLHQ